jgi:hypothetical protein
LNERTGKLIWSGKAGNQFFDPDHIAVAGVSRLCRHDVTGRHDTSGADGLERLRLRERHLQAALDGPSVRSFRRPCDLRQDNLHSRSQSPIACLRRDRVRTFFMPTTVARHNLARSSQRPLHQSRDRERDHIRIPERQLVDAFRASGCGSSERIPLWAYSAPQTQLGSLAVAQNTLYAGTAKGWKPSFPPAAPSAQSAQLQPGSTRRHPERRCWSPTGRSMRTLP